MMLLAPWLALNLVSADAPAPVPPQAAPAAAPVAAEIWHLTLPEAIRLSLENSEIVRVFPRGAGAAPGDTPPQDFAGPVALGEMGMTPKEVPPAAVGPHPVRVAIARLNADTSIWNFKAAIMAHVRSVEQTYWALSMAQVNLWSRETAVRLGEEILRSERAAAANGGRGAGTIVNVKEAEQQLENFKLNLITATSDLVTTERQLRNILGLPAADDRRIVPATAPTEARVEPNWDASVKQMLAAQPDVVQQAELVRAASLLAAMGSPLAEDKVQARAQRERQQGFLQQAVHEATHGLSRFFLEIDANYKQFEAARRLREAAQRRLDVQRESYGEGRITVDRVLDAVTQYANATSQEAQYRSSYNTSIAAFEEARGTLLAYEGIALSPGTVPRKYPDVEGQPAPAAPASCKIRLGIGGFRVLDLEVEVQAPAGR